MSVVQELTNLVYCIYNLKNYAQYEGTIPSGLWRFYTKDGDLRRNKWKVIECLRLAEFSTYDKLVDAYKLYERSFNSLTWAQDENNIIIPVGVKEEVVYDDPESAFVGEFNALAEAAEEDAAAELEIQMSKKQEKELRRHAFEEAKAAKHLTNFTTGNKQVDELTAVMFGEPEDIKAFAECLISAKENLKIDELLPVLNDEAPYRNPDVLSDEEKVAQEEKYKNFPRNADQIPCVETETYSISSFEEMCELIRKSFVGSHFPTKVSYTLHFIIESHVVDTNRVKNNTVQGNDNVYYQPAALQRSMHINSTNFVVSTAENIEDFIKKVKEELSEYVINPNNFFKDTKSLIIACYGFTLCKYNIGTTGTVCPQLEIFAAYEKAHTIRVHGEQKLVDDKLCVFRAIAEALIVENNDTNVPKEQRHRYITKKAKELYQRFYNSKYPWIEYGTDTKKSRLRFDGELINADNLVKLSRCFKIGFDIYDFEPSTKVLKYMGNHTADGRNLVNYSFIVYEDLGNGFSHMMFVPDITKIQKSITCRHCNQVMFKNTRSGRISLREHEAQCENKNNDNTQTLKTDFEKPYCPVFYNNKLYVYMITHDLKEYYKPMKYYMTYDFETMDSLIKGDEYKNTIDASTQKLAFLKPFSVAVAWKTRTLIDKKYFCLYNIVDNELVLNNNFVEEWLDFCLKKADEIATANYEYFVEDLNNNGIQISEELEKLIKEWSQDVNIVGWNSAKFDSNFLLQHLSGIDPKNIFIMGNQGNNKLVTFKTAAKNTLIFCDGCNYASKCSLDKATQSFGGNKERVKGVYPYSIMTDEHVEEVLLETKPFPIESFFNSLTQQPLSQDLYNKYVEDFKNYKNFYEYTQYYNEQDCRTLCEISCD